jgi:hypothetical protein
MAGSCGNQKDRLSSYAITLASKKTTETTERMRRATTDDTERMRRATTDDTDEHG